MKTNDKSLNALEKELKKQQDIIDKAYEPYQKISKSIDRLQEPLKNALDVYKDKTVISPALESIQTTLANSPLNDIKTQMVSPEIDIAKHIRTDLLDPIHDMIQHIVESYHYSIVDAIQIPTFDWLRSFDFNPITDVLSELQIHLDNEENLQKLNEIYLKTMLETKWFPYAGWIADISLFQEVIGIINSSRGVSKNREKRIDRAIISYYTKNEINSIRSNWWNSDLDFCLRKSLSQAISAYLRKEYVLTISCLSTMWEGLIYMKSKGVPANARKRQSPGITKDNLKKLIEENDYELIFSDYYENFIISNCNEVNDVLEGVPNRHGVAHGWYNKYPNKKAALNAILFTDFIVSMEPIEKTEENNGQVKNENE